MDVRQIYVEAQADLRRCEAELAILQQRVVALTKIVEGVIALDPSVRGSEREAPQASLSTRSSAVGRSSTEPVGDFRDGIREAVRTSGSFLSTQEIIDWMVSSGRASEGAETAEAVRKVISRMARAGALARERRDGRSFSYGLPRDESPMNAESPAATGLSVVPAPTSDEGRTACVEGSGDRKDHLPRWNDSDGRGAPSVVEG